MAETVGFEPTVSCPTHAFQACRFVRSRTSPGQATTDMVAEVETNPRFCSYDDGSVFS